MSTEDDIDAFLAAAQTGQDRSKLDPYAKLIRELRRKKWTYKRITEALKTEFGVSVSLSTVQYFYERLPKKNSKTTPEAGAEAPPLVPPKPSSFSPKPRRYNLDA